MSENPKLENIDEHQNKPQYSLEIVVKTHARPVNPN